MNKFHPNQLYRGLKVLTIKQNRITKLINNLLIYANKKNHFVYILLPTFLPSMLNVYIVFIRRNERVCSKFPYLPGLHRIWGHTDIEVSPQSSRWEIHRTKSSWRKQDHLLSGRSLLSPSTPRTPSHKHPSS